MIKKYKGFILLILSITIYLSTCALIGVIKGKKEIVNFTYDLEPPSKITFEEINCIINLTSLNKENNYTTIACEVINNSGKILPLANFKIWVLDGKNLASENLSYYSEVLNENTTTNFLCKFPNKYTEEAPIRIFVQYLDYKKHTSYLRNTQLLER